MHRERGTSTNPDRPEARLRPVGRAIRRLTILSLLASTTLTTGCATLVAQPGSSSTPPQEELFVGPIDGRVTAAEIEEMVQGFADRYSAVVTSACEAIGRTTEDPTARHELNRFQTRTISAIFDIATNEDAYTKLLDLVVVVSLTAEVVIAQGTLTDQFGDRIGLLTEPLQRSREEIDAMAARCLTARELIELDRLITGWRRDNPDVVHVAFVRFDTFASSRSKDVLAKARSGSGLLAPISDAVDEVTRTRLLAERAFYMAKRAPLLLSLETQAMMSQLAAMPEIQRGLTIGDGVAASADRLTLAIEAMPSQLAGERDEIVASIERTSGMLQSTLGEYRRAIERTDELIRSMQGLSGSGRELLESLDGAAATLTETITAAERVAKLFAAEPVAGDGSGASGNGASPASATPEKPFDPEIYARMVADLRGSIEEINRALIQTQQLAAGGLWDGPARELDRISRDRVDHAGRQAEALVDRIFWRSLTLLAAAAGLLIAYRVAVNLLPRRSVP
jgi:hypothetical protein